MSGRREPTTRLLLAIIAGLAAVVLALSVIIVNITVDRAAVAAEQAEYQRIINQLTKRVYWLEHGGSSPAG